MSTYLSWGQLVIALLTFIRSLLMIFAPEKVISSTRITQLQRENLKTYSLKHGIVLMELSLLFLVMTFSEPKFFDVNSYLYVAIYLLALVILFTKMYTIDREYL